MSEIEDLIRRIVQEEIEARLPEFDPWLEAPVEVGQYLNLKPRTVSNLISSGTLKAGGPKFGQRVVRRSECDRYLEQKS